MQPVLGGMRQVLGAPTTLFRETQVFWCVRRNKRSKGISSLASSSITHILHHMLPAFVLLQSYLDSVRKCKNAVYFKKKSDTCPWFSVCCVLGAICQPSALPGWRFHSGPCFILFLSPYSVWICWERGFWSPIPSHSLMWALQDAEFVGDPFLAKPPRGCRREPRQSNTLSALTVVHKFGKEPWGTGNQ